MSLDPRDLEIGNKISFGGPRFMEVTRIDYGGMSIHFENGDVIKIYSDLWEIAELQLPELRVAELYYRNCYFIKHRSSPYSASRLLALLKRDVAALEEVGVREEDE